MFFLGALSTLLVTLAAGNLVALPELHLLVPLAGLSLAASASRAGLTPLLGSGLLGWLGVMLWLGSGVSNPLTVSGAGVILTAFLGLFLLSAFLRSRITWIGS